MNFKKMDDEDIVKKVTSDFDRSEENQRPYFDRFKEYYMQYRGYIEEQSKRPNGANLFIPKSFTAVETLVPRLVSAMFSSRPYISARPLGQEDVPAADNMEKLLDHQCEQFIDIVPLMTKIFRNTFIYGTGIVKTGWKKDVRTVKTRRPAPSPVSFIEPMLTEEVEEEVVMYDAPHIMLVPLEDFYFDPTACDIGDAEYVIHRYFEPKETVLKKIKAGIYDKVDEEKLTEQSSESQHASIYDRVNYVNGTAVKDTGIEILEYWTDDKVIRVGNRSVLLTKPVNNPYYHGEKPFIRFVDYELDGEFYGMGEMEISRSLQLELNTTRNQRIDNVTMCINNMWKVMRNSGIDTKQLISRPNGFIEVDDMNELEPIKIPDMTQSAYNEEEIIKNDIDDVTGVNDYVRGSSPDRRETATTSSLLTESASERVKVKITLFEKGPFRKLGIHLISLNQQFVEPGTKIRITGDDGTGYGWGEVSPQDIAGRFDLIPTGSIIEPTSNKEVRQNQLVQLYGMVAEDPYINKPVLLEKLFKAFEFKDIDGLIVDSQEQQQQQQMAPMEENLENIGGSVADGGQIL